MLGFSPLSTFPLSTSAASEPAAPAAAAPGWDTQVISAGRTIATAAAVFISNIDAVFVPPAAQPASVSFESHVVSVAKPKRATVADSTPFASKAILAGFEAQTTFLRRKPLARVFGSEAFTPRQASWGFEPIAVRLPPRRQVSVDEVTPIAGVAATPALEWGFEPQAALVRSRRSALVIDVSPTVPVAVTDAALEWGFEPSVTRGLRRGTSGVAESAPMVREATPIVPLEWGFDSNSITVNYKPATLVWIDDGLAGLGTVVAPEPPVAPVPGGGGGVLRAGSGRFTRVDDGLSVRLRVLDGTAYATATRPLVTSSSITVSAGAVADAVRVFPFVVVPVAAGIVTALADPVRIEKDDSAEVLRMLKLAQAKPTVAPSKDVRGIWSLIDAMKGKKKP